ncbi:hypothetical protein TWF696_000448 [Orbilia brochopaga]|uniref:Uncharacterized protein n=1 Tax=Orbilia brochopaga TaxID=3140254 RepID=A0AAV9VED8_9PEZI
MLATRRSQERRLIPVRPSPAIFVTRSPRPPPHGVCKIALADSENTALGLSKPVILAAWRPPGELNWVYGGVGGV